MKLLIFLIKWGFPLLLITDLSSDFLKSGFLLNISRVLRLFLLILFIMENIKYFKIIRSFYFYKYFVFFSIILFIYLFTDRDFFSGLWIYSKIIFWILGINVLFAYGYKNIFTLADFMSVINKVVYIAFSFTILFVFSGYIKDNYNVAAYLYL